MEINEIVLNYVKNDKTNRSMLLTSPWGEGKTFYVKNILMPFLKESEIKSSYISLYGLNDVHEISKAIYLDIRLGKLNKKSGAKSAAKLLGKTILQGVASYFNVNLSVRKKELEKLYESINYKNRLLIIDDLERCSLNIKETLGYINNLVESDNAKVLLIADEHRIQRRFGDDYTEIKEKTIGDTIRFNCDMSSSILGIIKLFDDNLTFKKAMDARDDFISEYSIEKRVMTVMHEAKNYNLRSFLAACQKTSDMFLRFKKHYDGIFLQNLFLGNVAYFLKQNQNKNTSWGNNKGFTSGELGLYAYPVMYPAYTYITNNTFNEVLLKIVEDTFKIARKQEIANKDLIVIYNWFESKESNVRIALNNITNNISDIESIPSTEYLRLINYLIFMRGRLNNDDLIDKCKKIILKNIENLPVKQKQNSIYLHSGVQLHDQNQINEFREFRNSVNDLVKNSKIEDINSQINDIQKFEEYIDIHKDDFVTNGGFVSKIGIDAFINRVKSCTASEIATLRKCFYRVYSFSNLYEYFYNDLPNLEQLLNKITKIKSYSAFDNIQKMQIEYFVDDIKEFIFKIRNKK